MDTIEVYADFGNKTITISGPAPEAEPSITGHINAIIGHFVLLVMEKGPGNDPGMLGTSGNESDKDALERYKDSLERYCLRGSTGM